LLKQSHLCSVLILILCILGLTFLITIYHHANWVKEWVVEGNIILVGGASLEINTEHRIVMGNASYRFCVTGRLSDGRYVLVRHSLPYATCKGQIDDAIYLQVKRP